MARLLKLQAFVAIHLYLAWMIGLRYMYFAGTTDMIDPDRTTFSFDPEALEGRLSTGYPVETYL
jgi:hypothetical protein